MEIIKNIGKQINIQNKFQIENLVNEYLVLPESRHIMICQYLALHGCYFGNNEYIQITPRFIEYANSIIKYGTTEEKINNYVKYVIDLFN